MFRELLITVINFFCDRDAFEFLELRIIPQLFGGKGVNDRVRVWSAGCATGEEAYSLAMLLAEHASRLAQPPKIQIFASDIDQRAVAEGRRGHYPAGIAMDVTPERLQRFFVPADAGYHVKRELRQTLLFTMHDLLRDPPFTQLDLISCRNLLIYLNSDMQKRVLATFHFALRPEGFLFLGSSESTDTTPSLFTAADKKSSIYSRRPVATHPLATEWITPKWRPRSSESPSRSGPRNRSMSELHQQVIESLAPPTVLINEEFDIEHISVNAGRFLHFAGGEPTRNLLKLVDPDLRAELHAALLEAKPGKIGAMVQSRRLHSESGGEPRWLSLTVRPVGEVPEAAHGFFLVIFDDSSNVAPIALGRPADSGAEDSGMDVIRRLEEELGHAHERIQLIIEQYETST